MKREEIKEYVTDLAIKLIKQKTVNYDVKIFPEVGPDGMKTPGEETKVVQLLAEEFASKGIKYDIHAKDPERALLIAGVGQKDPSYRKLLVLAHTDVVPTGNPEQWIFNTFKAFEKEGIIYGRGSSDNKGPLASVVGTLLMLKNCENDIKGEFIFAAVPDEEVQSGCGIEYMIDNRLIVASDAIVPDVGGSMKIIDIAEKGRLVVRIDVEGKQAHASKPEKGVNAIYALIKIIHEIENTKLKYKPEKLLQKPTVNLGLISGGNAPNTVAGSACATFDIRTLPGQTSDDIIQQFESVSIKTVLESGCRVRFTVLSEQEPTFVREDASIVKKIKKYAPDAKCIGIGGGTFCKSLIKRMGIDAVGFAPGSFLFQDDDIKRKLRT